MAAPLLQLTGIALTFGGAPLLEAVDLMVSAGGRLCLVGRNGSGKSTLLRIAAGLGGPDSGAVLRQADAAIRYLPDEPGFFRLGQGVGLCGGRSRPQRRPRRAPLSRRATRITRRRQSR